ncbi:MAG: carboxypeptidase regulatory-like domain-containing protein, partial [Bacteroidota bacterium]
MSQRKIIFSLFALLFAASGVWAQNGTIVGKVTDAEGGEALVGATVLVLNQDSTPIAGANAADDGSYKINVAAGTYTLQCKYISYESMTFGDFVVEAGKTVTKDFAMGADLDDEQYKVVIQDKVIKNNEAALINVRRRSSSVMDVISMDQVKRAGDASAAGAMKRVTGVTVESGKYVYVRGLGDRYSKTLLNGNEIPGLDPNRNSVQMDMFPSGLIENLMVHKTFTPDLPGSFTGGLVKISTRDFPPAFTLQYSSSFGYNTNATFRDDFITGRRGKLDWLGFDDGTRALPEELEANGGRVPDITFNDQGVADQLTGISRSFGSPIYLENSNSSINHRHSFTIGDQKSLFGKPFGFVASLSYNNRKSF